MKALELATLFHEIYERRAPEFGYETRKETRAFDPSTANGRLMVAVCGDVLDQISQVWLTIRMPEGEIAGYEDGVEIMGVFFTEEDAVKAATRPYDVIGAVQIGENYGEATINWPSMRYPNLRAPQ